MLAPQNTDEEPPPFLQSWRRIYFLVLLYLFTLIAVLWAVSKYFSWN